MLAEAVNLEQRNPRLSEIIDQVHDNDPVVLTRDGEPVAVMVDIVEYRRLKDLEKAEEERDFAILLADNPNGLPEAEAIELAVRVSREVRKERARGQR